MAKFSLIQNPTFKADVMVPQLGSQTVKVGFVFVVV
ncbi:phage tail assembly chaperone [Pseudomonas piscis]|uniref:Phage tail assembly chaperone n=1 Tax=Pseudomonas piscis TaxID=2614538 RepID=A0ABY9NMY8_9PSED|nr:phage tail assembly chaperone [Pseudomonas piscis]WMN19924.1 phage tail assembly chaperone [Pseudomonas piscis]